jgi:hypothetical protein
MRVVVVVVVVLFCFLGVLIIVLHKKWYRSGSRARRKRQEGQSGLVDLLGSRRKKERKKENSGLGMLSTSSYTQKTGVWVLFFWGGPPAFLW